MKNRLSGGERFHWQKFIIVLCMLLIGCGLPLHGQTLFINEVLASNQTGITDEDGDTSDWIELYNAGTDSADLSGYFLTDDSDCPDLWGFPSIRIGPSGYLLIWASGKDRKDPSALHTSFKLNASGEYIGFLDPGGNRIDGFTFGSQQTDVSYGRFPDGGDNFMFFQNPTPAAMNIEEWTLSVSLPSGVYQGSIAVELKTNVEEGIIHFTLGGDEPNADDSIYSGPLIISSTRVLRARVFVGTAAKTEIATRLYILNEDPNLPVLSLSTEWNSLWNSNTGIYVNPDMRGIEWERLGHAMMIEANETRFSLPAGIRIHGDLSRFNAKKSFRLYFREEYGADALHYFLFSRKDIDYFKRLVIYGPSKDQVTGSYPFTLLTDALNHALFYSIGGIVSVYRPVSLYLNSKYWGLYWIRERIDRYYIEENFGVTDMDLHRDDWFVWKMQVKEGDAEYWLETLDFFEISDLRDPEKFLLAKNNYVDIDNYTDYYILNIFGGNYDWPQKNVDRYRDRAGDPRWKWIMWDTDVAWREPQPDIRLLFWATRSEPDPGRENDCYGWLWSTLIIRRLLSNDGYRIYFINRFADLMNTLLLPGNVIAHLDTLYTWIRPEMEREMARWGEEGPWGVQNVADWERNVDDVRTFARRRPGYQREHIMEKFGIEDTVKVVLLPSVGMGSIGINTITPGNLPWEGIYFKGIPVTVRAVPSPGYVFYGWSDPSLPDQPEVTVSLDGDRSFQAVFHERMEVGDILVESVTDSSAAVSWSTNVASIGRIFYGLSGALGTVTAPETEAAETHRMLLEDLEADTAYYYQIVCTDSFGQEAESAVLTFRTLPGGATGVFPQDEAVPEQFQVSPNYPNPFNGTTCWEAALPEPGHLRAVITNISGQRVHCLYDGECMAGFLRMEWDGSGPSGATVGSGIYIADILFKGRSGKIGRASSRLVMIR